MAGIYIHIPFCEKKCIYCDFFSVTNKSLIDCFISSLLKEITLLADAIDKVDKKNVETIYFGGGTPSILSTKAFDKIFNALFKNFNINKQCEITIECNPGTDFTSKLAEFKSFGINRISIGVQSLNPKELKFLTRIHTRNEAIEAIQKTLSFFENVNVDIIFSLPNQTRETLLQTIDEILRYDIKHLSAYSLIYEEGTPLHNKVKNKEITPKSDEEDYDLYMLIVSNLKEKNFEHYEISNFAKNGFKSLHNLNYWRYGEYYGLGPSAHSFWDNKRSWNIRSLRKYIQAIEKNTLPVEGFENIDTEKRIIEKIMLGLRAEGISISKFQKEFGVDLASISSDLIQNWVRYGKAQVRDDQIKLTDEGYFICNKLVLDLTERVLNYLGIGATHQTW